MRAASIRARTMQLAMAGSIALASSAPARAADQALIDAAKKEGQVVWYTVQIVNQLVVPMAAAFKKKYGIDVKYVRANSNEVALRVLNESKAGRLQVDIIDGTNTVPALRKSDLVLKWLPDDAARLPKEAVDPEGYWVATNIYINTPGFNTELVKKGTEPRTYEALLDPKWKGKMAWGSTPSTSGGPGFIGTVLREMGPQKGREYLEKLSKQQIAGLNVAARQVLDQSISGEYAIALQIFNHHTIISAAKGAPTAWIPMEPATATPSVAGVIKGAPHLNAGKLLLDFMISEEGQKIFRDTDYMPADPKVPPKDPTLVPAGGKFRAHYFTPEQTDVGMPGWFKIYQELFR